MTVTKPVLRAATGDERATTVRPATPDDADTIVRFILMAGDGLPVLFWSTIAAPGADPIAVGRERARRDGGGFSWRNTVLAVRDGRAVGGLVGYALAPGDGGDGDDAGVPAPIRPLLALEAKATGRWYVNVLAVDPAARRRGVATRLLAEADILARRAGTLGPCLTVADSNVDARRLYRAAGFAEVAAEPMVKTGWTHPGSAWILMTKDLPA
jgi:ribosomal protein S18 acetylase RimI-like enzyme